MLIGNYYGNQLTIYVIFLAKKPTSPLSQLLSCVHSLFFFVLRDNRLNIFGFWTVSWTKTMNLKTSALALGKYDAHFSNVLIYYRPEIEKATCRSMDNENNF